MASPPKGRARLLLLLVAGCLCVCAIPNCQTSSGATQRTDINGGPWLLEPTRHNNLPVWSFSSFVLYGDGSRWYVGVDLNTPIAVNNEGSAATPDVISSASDWSVFDGGQFQQDPAYAFNSSCSTNTGATTAPPTTSGPTTSSATEAPPTTASPTSSAPTTSTPTTSPPTPAPAECDSYCADMQAFCTSVYSGNNGACLEACFGFDPSGTTGDTTGNTFQCRAHFAADAQTNIASCNAATPSGGGICADTTTAPPTTGGPTSAAPTTAAPTQLCTDYCTAMGSNCPTEFEQAADCFAACSGYATTGGDGDMTGDTVQCRISRANVGGSDCAFAGVTGGGVCGAATTPPPTQPPSTAAPTTGPPTNPPGAAGPFYAVARFEGFGVYGTVSFGQTSASASTSIIVNLAGLDQQPNAWHVHMFPVTTPGQCGAAETGGHFNPLGVNVALCATSTNKQVDCEVGDLGGKHGVFATPTVSAAYVDSNLPLQGENSIVGRSIVIHNSDGSRKACATIFPRSSANQDVVVNHVVATFTTPLTGAIHFWQLAGDAEAPTAVLVDLVDTAGVSTGHNWHVHQTAVTANDCASTGGHYNPFGVDVARCALVSGYDKMLECEVGDLGGKHGALDFPATGSGKLFYTDARLPLSGANSINGRSITVHAAAAGAARYGCGSTVTASATAAPPTNAPTQAPTTGTPTTASPTNPPGAAGPFYAAARFEGFGVYGTVLFGQASVGAATTITVDLAGLDQQPNAWHVHMFPVTTPGQCGAAETGGHFNPLGVNVALCATSTNKQVDCEVGDLGGKHGVFATPAVSATYSDTNLPLQGKNSIVGRSIVIHNSDGSRKACATIFPRSSANQDVVVRHVVATFVSQPLTGTIHFWQLAGESNAPTTVLVDVAHTDASTTSGHSWHVHQTPVDNFGDCASTGGHYNPFGVDVTRCALVSGYDSKMLECEVGDLGGKHGALDFPATGSGKLFYTDARLPLSGANSINGRSITVHAAGSGASRFACASTLIAAATNAPPTNTPTQAPTPSPAPTTAPVPTTPPPREPVLVSALLNTNLAGLTPSQVTAIASGYLVDVQNAVAESLAAEPIPGALPAIVSLAQWFAIDSIGVSTLDANFTTVVVSVTAVTSQWDADPPQARLLQTALSQRFSALVADSTSVLYTGPGRVQSPLLIPGSALVTDPNASSGGGGSSSIGIIAGAAAGGAVALALVLYFVCRNKAEGDAFTAQMRNMSHSAKTRPMASSVEGKPVRDPSEAFDMNPSHDIELAGGGGGGSAMEDFDVGRPEANW